MRLIRGTLIVVAILVIVLTLQPILTKPALTGMAGTTPIQTQYKVNLGENCENYYIEQDSNFEFKENDNCTITITPKTTSTFQVKVKTIIGADITEKTYQLQDDYWVIELPAELEGTLKIEGINETILGQDLILNNVLCDGKPKINIPTKNKIILPNWKCEKAYLNFSVYTNGEPTLKISTENQEITKTFNTLTEGPMKIRTPAGNLKNQLFLDGQEVTDRARKYAKKNKFGFEYEIKTELPKITTLTQQIEFPDNTEYRGELVWSKIIKYLEPDAQGKAKIEIAYYNYSDIPEKNPEYLWKLTQVDGQTWQLSTQVSVLDKKLIDLDPMWYIQNFTILTDKQENITSKNEWTGWLNASIGIPEVWTFDFDDLNRSKQSIGTEKTIAKYFYATIDGDSNITGKSVYFDNDSINYGPIQLMNFTAKNVYKKEEGATVCLWAKRNTTLPAGSNIFSSGGVINIDVLSQTNVRCYLGSGTAISQKGSVDLSGWKSICCVMYQNCTTDPKNLTILYINGAQVANASGVISTGQMSLNTVTIGARNNGQTIYSWKGWIDHLMIANYSMTSSQITSWHNQQLPLFAITGKTNSTFININQTGDLKKVIITLDNYTLPSSATEISVALILNGTNTSEIPATTCQPTCSFDIADTTNAISTTFYEKSTYGYDTPVIVSYTLNVTNETVQLPEVTNVTATPTAAPRRSTFNISAAITGETFDYAKVNVTDPDNNKVILDMTSQGNDIYSALFVSNDTSPLGNYTARIYSYADDGRVNNQETTNFNVTLPVTTIALVPDYVNFGSRTASECSETSTYVAGILPIDNDTITWEGNSCYGQNANCNSTYVSYLEAANTSGSTRLTKMILTNITNEELSAAIVWSGDVGNDVNFTVYSWNSSEEAYNNSFYFDAEPIVWYHFDNTSSENDVIKNWVAQGGGQGIYNGSIRGNLTWINRSENPETTSFLNGGFNNLGMATGNAINITEIKETQFYSEGYSLMMNVKFNTLTNGDLYQSYYRGTYITLFSGKLTFTSLNITNGKICDYSNYFTPVTNKWYTIAFSINTTNCTFCVDEYCLVNSTAEPWLNFKGSGTGLFIGSRDDAVPANMSVDEVMLFNKTLTMRDLQNFREMNYLNYEFKGTEDCKYKKCFNFDITRGTYINVETGLGENSRVLNYTIAVLMGTLPITVVNAGNVKVNVTLGATDMFDKTPTPTENYNSSIGCVFGCDWARSDWMPINETDAPDTIFRELTYSRPDPISYIYDATTNMEICVPSDESAGKKSSTLTFVATQS